MATKLSAEHMIYAGIAHYVCVNNHKHSMTCGKCADCLAEINNYISAGADVDKFAPLLIDFCNENGIEITK